jgi:hypothetical protein
LICAFFDALRKKPLVVLFWIGLLVAFIYFGQQLEQQDNKAKSSKPKPLEDTRSGNLAR